jgi:hypothetical protein
MDISGWDLSQFEDPTHFIPRLIQFLHSLLASKRTGRLRSDAGAVLVVAGGPRLA